MAALAYVGGLEAEALTGQTIRRENAGKRKRKRELRGLKPCTRDRDMFW